MLNNLGPGRVAGGAAGFRTAERPQRHANADLLGALCDQVGQRRMPIAAVAS